MSATLKKLSSVNDHFDCTALSKSTSTSNLKEETLFHLEGNILLLLIIADIALPSFFQFLPFVVVYCAALHHLHLV